MKPTLTLILFAPLLKDSLAKKCEDILVFRPRPRPPPRHEDEDEDDRTPSGWRFTSLSLAAEAQCEPTKAPSSGAAGGKAIVAVSKSTPELPRKSEGDVIELTDGRLLLVSMEFGGDGSDFATTRLVAHESSDGGLTWDGHRVITDTAPGDVNVYSPNLIRAKDGGILLIFHRLHGKVGSGYSYTLHAWKSADGDAQPTWHTAPL